MNSTDSKGNSTSSQLIDRQIAELNDWHGRMLAQLRNLILETITKPQLIKQYLFGTEVTTNW
jgi:hypothetical protein